MQIGLKRVKVEGDGESAIQKEDVKVEVAAHEEVKVAYVDQKEEDDEPFEFDPTLFPVLQDDELEKLIAEWKSTNPLWTISVPSLRPSSVGCDDERQ
jgi:hypothetical protein